MVSQQGNDEMNTINQCKVNNEDNESCIYIQKLINEIILDLTLKVRLVIQTFTIIKMASIIEQTHSSSSRKPIPPGAIIIEINDDQQDQDASDKQYYQWLEKEYIEEAILSKNLDSVKKAIFTFLSRTRFKTDKIQAEKTIRTNYIQYFKLKMNLDISRAFYRSPHQAQDPNAIPDTNQIIVHGIDFLSNAQLENKFKGIHPVTIQRINASNASIKFNPSENVQNIISLFKDNKKDSDLCEIEQEGWSKWKPLKKYDVLGFERPLKYRFAAQNQSFTEKEDYNLKNYQINKAKIQESDLFITCKEDKDFYDLKIKEFEDTLFSRKPRYSRSRRSENGQSERSRTRDRKFGGRNENNEGRDFKIDNFDRNFNRNDRNDRGERGNFTDRGNFGDRNRGGYQTERRNFDNRNGDFRRENRGGYGDRDNQDRQNFRRNNGRDPNSQRQNRFFNKNKRQNQSRIEEEKDISYELPKKSVSRSKSRSNSSRSRSYKANESIEAPFNPANVSMSFHLPEKSEPAINQDVSQSFFMNSAMNNSVINPIQDVTQSFILPEKNHKQQEDDDNKSQDDLENILKKLDEHKQEMEKPRNRSRSNSSVASRRNSSEKHKKSGSVRGSNKGSQKSFNNRDNQRNDRGNNGDFGRRNNFNNRDSNYGNNRFNNNDSGYNNQNGGRSNNFRQNGDTNGNGFERKGYGNRGDNRDFNNQERNRDFNRGSNNGQSRFSNNQEREGQNRNFNNNNRYDRFDNNNGQKSGSRYDDGGSNAFDQYKKKEKPKVTENLMDEDQIEY